MPPGGRLKPRSPMAEGRRGRGCGPARRPVQQRPWSTPRR